MSWYRLPTLTKRLFAPISFAAASARLATCKEWLKVPGAFSDKRLNCFDFVSENSNNVISETKPIDFS